MRAADSLVGVASLLAADAPPVRPREVVIRLESLRDGRGIVVLIHGRDAATFEVVVSSFRSLAGGNALDVRLHELPGVVASDGCQIVATNRRGRPGIWSQPAAGSYKWSQDPEGWLQVAELAEPVSRSVGESGAHFQFLEESGEATVVISTERAW